MNTVLVLEKTQTDTMNGGITPTFIKETASPIKMIEIVLVFLAAPEAHIGNLEITPEMASRVPSSIFVVEWATKLVRQPFHGIIRVHVIRVLRQELLSLGPQGRDGFGGIVKIDGEAVRLVVVLHVPENIVVDVAKEVDLGLYAPIVLSIGKGRVLVKHATIPAAHLMVGHHIGVLNTILLQDFGRFFVKVHVDPRWHLPVLLWNQLISALGLCEFLGFSLEFLGKWDVVEEGPGVVEFVVPRALEIAHRREHILELFISYESQQGGVDSCGAGGARCVFFGCIRQDAFWFARCCKSTVSIGIQFLNPWGSRLVHTIHVWITLK